MPASIVHFQNVASDVASTLDQRLADRRRSEPFRRLAERTDNRMPGELGPAIERAITSLRGQHEAVAEEIEQDYLSKWRQLSREP